MQGRQGPVVAVAAIAWVCLALLMSQLPALGLPVGQLALSTAIETATTVIALLGLFLAYGRARRSGSLGDALLAAALLVFAVTSAAFALPSLVSVEESAGAFAIWAPLAGRTLGALLFFAAAMTVGRRLTHPHRQTVQILAAAGASVLTCGMAATLLDDVLPVVAPVVLEGAAEDRREISELPAVAALLYLRAAVFWGAAIAFGRRFRQDGVDLHRWLAVGALLGGVSAAAHALVPGLYSEHADVGEFMRLGFYLFLFVGSLLEVRSYQEQLQATAVRRERRRLARDLHDGLAQELAYITSQVRRMEGRASDPERIREIVRSAERALAESRAAISALSRSNGEPLVESLIAAAVDAGRGRLLVDVTGAVRRDVDQPAREALVRIVSEAATNAVRHGAAGHMEIALEEDGAFCMRLTDDGRGFDPEARLRNDAFGLQSMRERAEALGGNLTISSGPGHGTTIEVVLP